MKSLFMQDPFLPTYDFDNIPTDEELVKETPKAVSAGPICPFPTAPTPKVGPDFFKKLLEGVKEDSIKKTRCSMEVRESTCSLIVLPNKQFALKITKA